MTKTKAEQTGDTYEVRLGGGEPFLIRNVTGTDKYNGCTALMRGEQILIEIRQERGNTFRIVEDD